MESIRPEHLPTQPAFEKIVEDYRRWHSETKIIFIGKLILLDKHYWLENIVRNLAGNCVERGATAIWITIDKGYLEVGDDIVHENPEEILANLNSDRSPTTKDHSESWWMRRELREHGGTLKYHEQNGNMIAVATWIE